jgi:hypothetical protein
VVALVDRLEHRGDPQREHEHPDHLNQRQQAEDPVVGVVRRREPGEVDPRPSDRERDEAERDQARADVVLGQIVSELVRGRAERDNERKVEEEL